jgi:sugar lactone lactonase YvrE
LNRPRGVAADAEGNVYVADTANHRIQKFDRDGRFLSQWGSQGSDSDQFSQPYGVAADAAGNVYVADTANHRIQKFSQNGNFLGQWGGRGNGEGEFFFPRDVATDAAGNVYVADTGNHLIQMFDQDGRFLSQWGGEGSSRGRFYQPYGVVTDAAGTIYVADTGNRRIQKFQVSSFVLDDAAPDDGDSVGNNITFNKLPMGVYQISERFLSGWDLSDLSCSSDGPSQVRVDLANRAATIDLAEGDNVTCIFSNTS